MRSPHPLDHQPAFRAVIAAAPPLAELAVHYDADLVESLVLAIHEVVTGFAAPPDSRRRTRAHHRAWTAIREIDREVTAIGRRRLAPALVVQKAQRAIDRADVFVEALLPT